VPTQAPSGSSPVARRTNSTWGKLMSGVKPSTENLFQSLNYCSILHDDQYCVSIAHLDFVIHEIAALARLDLNRLKK
jgi:hypothetical protein